MLPIAHHLRRSRVLSELCLHFRHRDAGTRRAMLVGMLAGTLLSFLATAAPAAALLDYDLIGRHSVKLLSAAGSLKFRDAPALLSMRDPRCPTQSWIHIKASNLDRQRLPLPCENWRFTGKGYRYEDVSGAVLGIQRIEWKSRQLQIKFKGPNHQAWAGPISFLEVRLDVHRKSYCGRFTVFSTNNASGISGQGSVACAPRPTPTITPTATTSFTPSLTPTRTPTRTRTHTPTRTWTPAPALSATATATISATPTGTLQPAIALSAPAHGSFIDPAAQSSVNVQGRVLNPSGGESVLVNGIAVTPDGNGDFAATVPLNAAAIFNPVLAQLRNAGAELIGQDRRIVIYGSSVADGAHSPQSVALRLNDSGLDQLEPAVTSLVDLDLATLVPPGTSLGSATLNSASLDRFGIQLDARVGSIFANVILYNLHVQASASGCNIFIDAETTDILGNYSLEPNAVTPSMIDVTQQGPVTVQFGSFSWHHQCGGFFGPLLQLLLPLVVGDLQNGIVKPGLEGFLNTIDANGNTPIAAAVEGALAGIDLAGSIGGGLGVKLDAPLFTVAEDNDGITLGTNTAFTSQVGSGIDQCQPPPGSPNFGASYHVAEAFPSFGTAVPHPQNPGQMLPFDLGLGISTSAFNQLLKAKVECGLLNTDLTEFDLGGGPLPLNAGLLAALIPEFGILDPELPLKIHLVPTIAPIVTGSSGPLGEPAELKISHLLLEVLDPANPQAGSYMSAAVDVRVGLGAAFDEASGDMAFTLGAPTPNDIGVTVLHNAIQTNPVAVQQSLPFLLAPILPSLASTLGTFPLPQFVGLQLRGIDISRNHQFLSLYSNLAPTASTLTSLFTPPIAGLHRNDFTGYAGAVFQTGAAPITVHELGFLDTNEQPLERNGGFDTSVASNASNSNGWTSANLDASGGWKSSGGNPGAYFSINSAGQCGSDPTLSQTFSGLSVGHRYVLSGDYVSVTPNAGNPNKQDAFVVSVTPKPSDFASIDVLTLARPNPATTWKRFTTSFVAAASSVTVTFTAERDCDDSAFGVDNLSLAGAPGLSTSHRVGLWHASAPGSGTGELIAEATIQPGTVSPLSDGFRWATITGGPVTLQAHTFYVVAAEVLANGDPFTDFTAQNWGVPFVGNSAANLRAGRYTQNGQSGFVEPAAQNGSNAAYGAANLRARLLLLNSDLSQSVVTGVTNSNGWTATGIDGNGGWRSSGGNPGGYVILNSAGECGSDPKLSQTVLGLTPGATYRLLGDYVSVTPQFGNANKIDAFGVTIEPKPSDHASPLVLGLPRPNPATTWTPFSVTFVAPARVATITFSAERNCDDSSFGVDNLRLVQVGS